MRRNCQILLLTTLALTSCKDEPRKTTEKSVKQAPDKQSEDKSAVKGDNPLYQDLANVDFSKTPELLAQIRASAHGYFRFTNRPFAKEVCRRLKELLPMPHVNLHGDAHLEQYAITGLGRGLTDFDDATSGPPIIDLVRFGSSLQLAMEFHDKDNVAEFIEEFFRGYRSALENPEALHDEPELVKKLRKRFPRSRKDTIAWAETVMDPKDFPTERFTQALAGYEEAMHKRQPDLPANFFKRKAIGFLRVGIGSALDFKFLMRVEGPTESPDDDELLEAKEVRDLSGIDCINPEPSAFRVLVNQSRLSYQPYRLAGYTVDPNGKHFWIHAWESDYSELTVQDLSDEQLLREVVRDAGIQLGLGHPRQIAAPMDPELRRALIELTTQKHELLVQTISEMSGLVTQAWKQNFPDKQK